MKSEIYDVVMLCTKDTIENINKYYSYFERYLLKKDLIIIGKKELKLEIESINPKIKFIDEDAVLEGLNYKSVRSAIRKTSNSAAECRTGWYFQQFLKMAYALICKDSTYLVWDSDTVPTHAVNMYTAEGLKVFDVKAEYHKPYFSTIQRLFPMLEKANEYSFISEHMLFDQAIMKELIKCIEDNDMLSGDCFWKKIISAINIDDITGSGFSEFETYGTYVEYFHKSDYQVRKWNSLREGTIFFGNGIDNDILCYLSKEYDAISFEHHRAHNILSRFFSHKIFRTLAFIKTFEKIKIHLKKFK